MDTNSAWYPVPSHPTDTVIANQVQQNSYVAQPAVPCDLTCTLGNKSGDQRGQGYVLIWWRDYCGTLGVCVWPFIILLKNTCWKLCHGWQKCGSKISRTYRRTVKVPSIKMPPMRGDQVSWWQLHTIRLGVRAMCRRKPTITLWCSLMGVQTCAQLSSLFKLNLDSFLKTT